MKTLDELIEKCQENVVSVNEGWDEADCFLSYDYMVDTLHYLKEYQKFRKALNLKVMGNEPLLEQLINVLRKAREEK